jgi:hypothetical protein
MFFHHVNPTASGHDNGAHSSMIMIHFLMLYDHFYTSMRVKDGEISHVRLDVFSLVIQLLKIIIQEEI